MKTTIILASLMTLALAGPIHKRQNNLQTFSGALGGIEATPIEDSGIAARPFKVKQDTFVNLSAALQRSCDQQFNACANAANGGDKTLSVAACSAQKEQCSGAGQGAQAPENANANQNQNQNQEAVVCTKKAKRGNKKAKLMEAKREPGNRR